MLEQSLVIDAAQMYEQQTDTELDATTGVKAEDLEQMDTLEKKNEGKDI